LGAIVRALKPAAAKRIARNAGPTPTYNPSMTALTLFDLHRAALDEYRSFVRSYINIADARICAYVDEQLSQTSPLWPEPLIQLSPTYEYGATWMRWPARA